MTLERARRCRRWWFIATAVSSTGWLAVLVMGWPEARYPFQFVAYVSGMSAFYWHGCAHSQIGATADKADKISVSARDPATPDTDRSAQ